MRRAAKVDANQKIVVKAFRDLGCTVQHLHAVGSGCPDLLVGIMGINLLVEVKDGDKPPSARKLTKDQVKWHGSWLGQKCIVKSVDEVIELVNQVRGEYSMKHTY